MFIIPTEDELIINGVVKPEYAAKKNIFLSNSNINTDLKLMAGETIKILTGTKIQSGTNFSATINPLFHEPCPSSSSIKSVMSDNTYPAQINNSVRTNFTMHDKKKNSKIIDETLKTEQLKNEINIYPNPSSSSFFVQNNSNRQIHSIEIYSSKGINVKVLDCIDPNIHKINIT